MKNAINQSNLGDTVQHIIAIVSFYQRNKVLAEFRVRVSTYMWSRHSVVIWQVKNFHTL